MGFSWVLSIIFTATYRDSREKRQDMRVEGGGEKQISEVSGIRIISSFACVCLGCGRTNDRNYFSILQWGRFIQICQSWECVRAEPAVICEEIQREERCGAVPGKSKIKTHYTNADVQSRDWSNCLCRWHGSSLVICCTLGGFTHLVNPTQNEWNWPAPPHWGTQNLVAKPYYRLVFRPVLETDSWQWQLDNVMTDISLQK